MALKAQEATGNEEITVLADRGYFSGDQVLACENTGVLPCVPKTLTSGNAKRGLFTGQDFVYDAEKDQYTCPAGEHLDKGAGSIRPPRRHRPLPPSDRVLHLSSQAQVYARQAKADQALETRTCPRRDASQARSDARCHGRAPQTVEHPFGTFKSWMGSTHFLTRTLKRVRTEMSLHVLAYNMKRVIAIIGVGPLLQAILACSAWISSQTPATT